MKKLTFCLLYVSDQKYSLKKKLRIAIVVTGNELKMLHGSVCELYTPLGFSMAINNKKKQVLLY